jgi:hypothetical protein
VCAPFGRICLWPANEFFSCRCIVIGINIVVVCTHHLTWTTTFTNVHILCIYIHILDSVYKRICIDDVHVSLPLIHAHHKCMLWVLGESKLERENEWRRESGVCNRSFRLHSFMAGQAITPTWLHCQSHCS